MTVVEHLDLSPEALGRTLVVLELGFVHMRYDRDSFAKIASKRRQVLFGVTLGIRESVFRLSYVRRVLEGEDTVAVIVHQKEPMKGVWFMSRYTDVLPLRIALYLESDVPEELGPLARRLEELIQAISERKQQGMKIPQEMKSELDELNQIFWARTRIFKRLVNKPGFLKITVPTPDGMTVISWKVESGGQSLEQMIELFHQHLNKTMGVLMSFENTIHLRDSIAATGSLRGTGRTSIPDSSRYWRTKLSSFISSDSSLES